VLVRFKLTNARVIFSQSKMTWPCPSSVSGLCLTDSATFC
jgi:hypothetical protein